MFHAAEQRECCEVDTEDGREPEASAGVSCFTFAI
jgi:hypothetical protein